MEVLDKDEMNRDEDLVLVDRTMGPLVLPGPSLTTLSVTLTQPLPQVEVEVDEAEKNQSSSAGEPNTILVSDLHHAYIHTYNSMIRTYMCVVLVHGRLAAARR